MFKFFLENKVRFALMFEGLKRKIKFVVLSFHHSIKRTILELKENGLVAVV